MKRSEFYSAVRAMYSDVKESVEVTAVDSRKFRLSIEEREDGKVIVGTSENHTIVLPAYSVLSPDAGERVSAFDRQIADLNLSDAAIRSWRERLKGSSLNDDEVDEFYEELKLNPLQVATAIANEVRQGKCRTSVLVPRSRTYYERLVGPSDDITNLESYVAERLSAQIEQLLDWDFRRGFARCLLFSAQPDIAPLIDIAAQQAGEVKEFFRWLDELGDRFSQVAGFEVGIGLVDRFPEIEPALVRIASKIRDDDPTDPNGRLKLSSSLCMFVDGELSRIALFRDKPPFWRRLAAIAQASLIERELITVGIVTGNFADWATQGRGQRFYMQTLVDLRLEPRWLPDLISPEQLQNEFISRMCTAADRAKEQISSGELRKIVVHEGPESIRSQMTIPFAFLPGPLEGGSIAPHLIPDEMVDELRTPTGSAVLEASFFAGIVNSSLVFRIEPEVAGLLAEILRNIKYRLNLDSEANVTFSLLAGLATVAAVTRSPELAEEVRILLRVLHRRDEITVAADNQMRIGLIACAATIDLNEWCEKVGDWFLEIAYEDINKENAEGLRSNLRTLCQIVPQLWRNCAQADAALAAAIGQAA